jgi:hypothetical protein
LQFFNYFYAFIWPHAWDDDVKKQVTVVVNYLDIYMDFLLNKKPEFDVNECHDRVLELKRPFTFQSVLFLQKICCPLDWAWFGDSSSSQVQINGKLKTTRFEIITRLHCNAALNKRFHVHGKLGSIRSRAKYTELWRMLMKSPVQVEADAKFIKILR